jgi:hypothetical protein
MLQILPATAKAVITPIKSLKFSCLFQAYGKPGAAWRLDVQDICRQLESYRQPNALAQSNHRI